MWKKNRNKTSDTPRYCLQLQHTHCKVGTKQIFLSLPWLLRLARLIPSLSFCPRLFLLWEAEIERLKLRGARETLCIVVAGIRGACVCTAALTCYIIWIDFRERGMKKKGHFIYRIKYLNNWAFMVPRGYILMTFVIPSLFLHHHEFESCSFELNV